MEAKFFKCNICGKIVAVVKDSAGKMTCCGSDMKELVANTTDAAVEKHVPVLEIEGNLAKVSVGSVAHPMEEKHFIEWIALLTDKGITIKNLKAGEKPEAVFAVASGEKVLKAYAYCNLHGLWSTK